MSRIENQDRNHRDELERALAEVLAEPLDDRQVEEAAARVWERLSSSAAAVAGAEAEAGAASRGMAAGQARQNVDASAPAVFSARSAVPSAPSALAASSAGVAPVGGCPDFGPQIPAFLCGELAPARALLLEDHTRECLPCRRALHAARQERSGHAAVALHAIQEANGEGRRSGRPASGGLGKPGWRREVVAAIGGDLTAAGSRRRAGAPYWAVAALLLVGVGLGVMLFRSLGPAAGARMARIDAIEGGLYRVEGATSVRLAAGAAVRQGEQIRTAKASHAVLRLNDGSQIEMAERAGLALAAGRDGNTIDLERGLIIVQAARQRPHHLYVATSDCLVSVTGTIFAVNHGTKGSRVSVVEGEVRVRQARQDGAAALAGAATPAVMILHPGEQVTTHPSVAAVPVRQEVAWSRNSARYDALLAELSAAGSDIDRQVALPGLRSSSRLLELVPAGSLLYVALPNLSASLQQTQQLLEQRLAESPVLQEWWSASLGSAENEARFHQLIQEIGDVGRYLGDEVVIAAGAGLGKGAAGSAAAASPVLLAEVIQEAQLRATLGQEVAAINQRAGKTALVLLDQLPAAGPPTPSPAASGPVLVWVGQGLLVASQSAAQIGAVAANLPPGATNPFATSSFHARLAQAYADGAGWLFAADLKQLVAGKRAEIQGQGNGKTAESMGLFDVEDLVVERHQTPAAPGAAAASGTPGTRGATETRAALSFSQARRGIASWLAAPAPMGSLGFFSGDANLVAAFVVKSPVELLDELLSLSPELAAGLAKAEAEHGFNLRDDLAAPLGGEIALGLDGPVLPSPSWQLVAEVYDPVRLQQTVARAIQQANAEQVASGKPGVALSSEQDGDRTYYTILTAAGSQPRLEVHYLYADGHLVAAPTRAQLDRALAQRAAGTTLASSPRLRGLLGRDGQVNVSALFYQNLGPVLGSLGNAAGSALGAMATGMTPRAGGAPGRAGFGGLMSEVGKGPSLLYAYAETDRIVFAGHSEAGPMGLNLETLAGFGGILGRVDLSQGAARRQRGGS
jgi:FecR protein